MTDYITSDDLVTLERPRFDPSVDPETVRSYHLRRVAETYHALVDAGHDDAAAEIVAADRGTRGGVAARLRAEYLEA